MEDKGGRFIPKICHSQFPYSWGLIFSQVAETAGPAFLKKKNIMSMTYIHLLLLAWQTLQTMQYRIKTDY